jgi:hypothetical protein
MKIIATLLVTIFFSVQLAAGAFLNPANANTEIFYPPCNLEGEDIGHAADLFWDAPGTCEPDSLPVETAGFRIYRDEVMIAETDGETFSYIDNNYQGFGYLPQGSYSYTITALYMVDDNLVESVHEGPVEVFIAPGFGYISGFVWDCISFTPIGGATITVGDFTTTSQSNGTFTILLFEFDTLEVHVSAPGYCDSTFLVIWNSWFFNLNFCLMPCDVSGSNGSAYKPDQINVFPVPANDILHVQVDAGIQRIRLIDYSGKIVFESNLRGEQSGQVDVSRFSAGIFTLQVIAMNDLILNRKVVIVR